MPSDLVTQLTPSPLTATPAGAARWLVRLFFAALILIGVLLHRDYGMSWDEENNHLNGLVSLKYVAQVLAPSLAQREALNRPWIPDIRHYQGADHGAAFEMTVAVLGYVLTNGDSQPVYYLRHLCVFLTFVLGVWAVYQIGRIRFQSWRWGLLGAGLLVLSPRFFAEAFYNGKDLVYMALFTVAVYTLIRLLQRPTLLRAVVHGLATAAATDIRVHGLQLLLLTALMLAWEARQRPLGYRTLVRVSLGYLLATLAFTFIGWPYLWAMSGAELAQALPKSGRFPWSLTTLYWGRFLHVNQLPWHYLPVWMLITTPLPYTLAALLGLGTTMSKAWQHGASFLRSFGARLDVLLIIWLLGPVAVVVFSQISLYDGWRHLYYVYPALLLLAVRGFRAAYLAYQRRTQWRYLAFGALAVAGLEVGHTAVRMAQMHPHQQVYFSFLPATTAERLFERDYWGLSYRQGLEWILTHDPAPQVNVSVAWPTPLYNNSLILAPAGRNRLRYVPRTEPGCHYFLTAYRWHPQSYLDSLGVEVHTVRAGPLTVLSVFDCRQTRYYQQVK
jgi:hypothetical protein